MGAMEVTKLTVPGRLTAPIEVNAAMNIAKPIVEGIQLDAEPVGYIQRDRKVHRRAGDAQQCDRHG